MTNYIAILTTKINAKTPLQDLVLNKMSKKPGRENWILLEKEKRKGLLKKSLENKFTKHFKDFYI